MNAYYKGSLISGPRGPAGPDGNPVGTVISFMGASAPKDYLICDGAEYGVCDYPDLAAFFQTQFGTKNHFGGDGETTFAVPDLRNLFLRGYHGEAEEQLSGEVGERQGATIHSNIGVSGDGATIYNTNGVNADRYGSEFDTSQGEKNKGAYTTAYNVLSASYPMPAEYTSRPVNTAVLYCIKAAESVPAENVYSTEETVIGRWIDGKPLYRRVFQGTIPQTASKDVWYVLFSIQEAETTANLIGKIFQGVCYYDTGIAWDFDAENQKIAFKNYLYSGFPMASDKYEVIVEYTKTTD